MSPDLQPTSLLAAKPFFKDRSFYWFLIAAFLFSLQVLPRIWTESPATDEAWETTSGYYYWTHGDVVSLNNHPPLADGLNALPLLFLPLKSLPDLSLDSENRAYVFYYLSNREHLEALLSLPRMVTLLFSLGIGFLIYLFVRNERTIVVLAALFFWVFEPNLLAVSTISKTDPGLCFFTILGLYLFLKGQEKASWKWDLWGGLVLGFAITSKMTGLFLLPIYLVLDGAAAWQHKWGISHLVKRWVFGLIGSAAAIFLVYSLGTLELPGHAEPFSYFALRLKHDLFLSKHLNAVLDTHYFFAGKPYPVESLWQFPLILFMKSTVPFFFFLVLGCVVAVSGRMKLPAWMWGFPLLWIGAIHLMPLIYLRYALPAYPALILMAARAVGWCWDKGSEPSGRAFRWVVLFAGVWTALSVLSYFGDQIGYVNDLLPPGSKYTLLDQHYYDLNQDLKRLGILSNQRKWQHIKLAYDGQDDPFYYGLPLWEPWTVNDLQQPRPGTVYLVKRLMLREGSAGFPIHQSWVKQMEPTGVLGDSWIYFEIPGTYQKDNSPILPSTPYLVYQNAPYRHGN